MNTYSIIIPHKNTPVLLQRCLNSIPEREDIEIIIVDDNSNPNIVNFKAFPGLLRKDVKVILTKEGKGAGYARNIGIENANGKWLLFADADDYFLNNFLNITDDYIVSNFDIIYFNATSVFSDTLEPAERHKDINNLINGYLKGEKHYKNKLRYMFYYPYAKLVKHELVKINSVRFDEILVTNDVWFSVEIGYYANEIIADKRSIYCLTVRKDSLSKIQGEDIFDLRVKTNLKVDLFMRKIKVKNSHHPMLTYIIQSRKYGLLKIFQTIYLSILNGSNIFIGSKELLGRMLKINLSFLSTKQKRN